MRLSVAIEELVRVQGMLSGDDPEVHVQVSCEGDPLSQVSAFRHNGEARVVLHG